VSTQAGLLGTNRALIGARRLTWRRVAVLVIALATLVFVVVNCVGLADPGLEYDELLYVNGALGVPHAFRGFIYSEAFGIPTMLMPYIGALKAWLYAPIFAIFGVSPDSVRIPVVLLAAVALLLAVALVRRMLGLWPAVAMSLLLSSDPVFGAMSRTDWGPIVLSALLRLAALFCYFAFLRTRSVRYLWLGVLALSLGLFNKLDYALFIAAFAAAAAVVHNRQLLDALRRRPVAVAAPIVALFGVCLAALFDLIIPADELPLAKAHESFGTRVHEVVNLFRGTFNGNSVYENMTGVPIAHTSLIGWLIPFVLLASAGVVVWRLIWGRREGVAEELRDVATYISFFLVLFVVLAIAITLTRQATGPWHVMLLWPLPDILVICLLVFAWRIPRQQLRLASTATLAAVVVLLLVTQIRSTADYVSAYRSDRPWTSPWSTEIYAATREVSTAAPGAQSVFSADWGLGTELFSLGNEALRSRFADDWASFMAPGATTAELERNFFDGHTVIVVFHSPSAQVMPQTSERVEAILKAHPARVHPIFAGRQIEADEVTP
jgi:4-amino-4-deoxy-L-arabinose transferase-like glycosyltransferase